MDGEIHCDACKALPSVSKTPRYCGFCGIKLVGSRNWIGHVKDCQNKNEPKYCSNCGVELKKQIKQ